MITALPKDIVSIGRLAGMLDTSRDRIEHAAAQCGAQVVAFIDGVPFFDAAGVDRIRERLALAP
jgi:hypothetical protein